MQRIFSISIFATMLLLVSTNAMFAQNKKKTPKTSNVVAQSPKTWNVDKTHSTVKFSVSHLVISEVEGSFKVYDGAISSSNEDFSNAQIDFAIDVASINTDNEMRDGHLKSDDFFNATSYPKMTFKSTSFKKKSGNKYELEGDLTIRSTTKKIKFEVTYGGTAKDGYGNTKAGFKAMGNINRFDYGLKWNVLTEAGGATVGKDIKIVLNLEFALKK
jgi:polyisoprenoid-binding protein YceI